MSRLSKIQEMQREADNNPELDGLSLRFDLAQIILTRMDHLGWNQKTLADKVPMKDAQLSRIIHSRQNCVLSVAARILRALGLEARLVGYSPDQKPPPVIREAKRTRKLPVGVRKKKAKKHTKA